MEDKLQTIDIHRLISLAPMEDDYALGDDFILGKTSKEHLEKSQDVLRMLSYPIRFDGYLIFYVKRGHVSFDLNLNNFNIQAGSLVVCVPGNIIKIASESVDDDNDPELDFVLASKEFMSDIRFDFNKVFQDSIRLLNSPCIYLDEDARTLAEDYFLLARKVMTSSQANKREILRALFTSFAYVTLDLWQHQLSLTKAAETSSSARVNQVFERFINLVTEYHCSQRGMAFYADKLCLTPKYLSKLVKQASGRSAPDWIDAFVILEAKNMLKYSDKAIKEIVYALHFPNQSVFYKFFKAHTGMTPSEYRKG